MNNDMLIDKDLKNEYEKLVEEDNLLPIKISDFYKEKVLEEVHAIGKGGPLYRSVIPTFEKINVKTSIETRDYVEEAKHNPVENCDYIIQKYNDRLILIVTDVCPVYKLFPFVIVYPDIFTVWVSLYVACTIIPELLKLCPEI